MKNKFAYITIRTNDLEQSIRFYQEILFLELISFDDRSHQESNKYKAAFMGYDKGFQVELIYNLEDNKSYNAGDLFGVLEIYTDSSDDIVKKLNEKNITYKEFVHNHNNINRRMITFYTPEGARIMIVHKGYKYD